MRITRRNLKSTLAVALLLTFSVSAVAFVISNLWTSPTVTTQGWTMTGSLTTSASPVVGAKTTFTLTGTNPGTEANKNIDFNVTSTVPLDPTNSIVGDNHGGPDMNSTLIGSQTQGSLYVSHYQTASGPIVFATGTPASLTVDITLWAVGSYNVTAWISGP